MDARDDSAEREVVLGALADAGRARDALGALRDTGFPAGAISVVMPWRKAPPRPPRSGTATEAHAAGAIVFGGALGGLAGWLAGLHAFTVPGVGPCIGAGVLASDAVGRVGAGGLAETLTAIGVSRERARWYGERARAGGVLLALQADERAPIAASILRAHGAGDAIDVFRGRLHPAAR